MTEPIDAYLRSALVALTPAQNPEHLEPAVTAELLELFRAQVQSRHLDIVARRLQEQGLAYYTIGSAGHEGNAGVAAALRPTDPALLHYRSGGFFLARAQQVPGSNGVRDVLLGLVSAAADPISGGRHKVFGNVALNIIPQTSTIASHLPRAVGLAFAIDAARRLGRSTPWPDDAIVVTSLGDASANHSTAVGALNAAAYLAFRNIPVPLLIVCEDNGIGISVPTPSGWMRQAVSRWQPLSYAEADGLDLPDTLRAARHLSADVRRSRRPAILLLRTVRFMGHAGSDAEVGYRSLRQIEADYPHDPLLRTARHLVDAGALTGQQALALYDEVAAEVAAVAAEVTTLPKLASTQQVMAPLLPTESAAVLRTAGHSASDESRRRSFQDRLPEHGGPLTLAQAINATLTDLCVVDPGVLVFGEDVGVKGGVYGVTRALGKRFGRNRVFDTLLDEQTILGVANGSALAGFLPIPEIQYLAYLHNAEDQLRGEAASLKFFSAGQYRNGMVVRVAGLAYQKGFGGHFHNDNSVAVLRDIPGLYLAVPASPADVPALLRVCAALARQEGRVCVLVEPIALYHTRDLHEEGDGLWLAPYQRPERTALQAALPGRAKVWGDGGDLTVLTFGNGLYLSRRVASRVDPSGRRVRIVDLRWLSPLPVADIVEQASQTGRVLVVDETRTSGGVSEAVVTSLVDAGFTGPVRRVASKDCFVPLGPAMQFVLLGEQEIEVAMRQMLGMAARIEGGCAARRPQRAE